MSTIAANVGCVSIGGRGVLIEGESGSGKSSLALALIDRGAVLVGDDGVALETRGDRLWARRQDRSSGRLASRRGSAGAISRRRIPDPAAC